MTTPTRDDGLPEPRLWYDPETQRCSSMAPLRPTYEPLWDEQDMRAAIAAERRLLFQAQEAAKHLAAENKRLHDACASGWGEPTLINTLRAELSAMREQLAESESERMEQARLLGISGSKEAALLARLAEAAREPAETAPSVRVPLTDGQILSCVRAIGACVPMGLMRDRGPYEVTEPTWFLTQLVRAIEAAHGITASPDAQKEQGAKQHEHMG